jgi:hypothetical protein
MSIQLSGSLILSGSLTATGGITMSGSIDSASYATSASYAFASTSASYALNTTSASISSDSSLLAGRDSGVFATTGSNTFVGNQTITGSIFGTGSLTINGCITATGQIVAQTINVQQVTSSVVYSCGDNIFGTALTNTQTLCGNVFNTGSLACFAGRICSNTLSVSSTTNLGGALTGTSATFSHNDAPTVRVQRDGGTDSNTVIEFTNASRSFYIGSNGTAMGLGGVTGAIGSQPLQISSTGIATFACQVCSPSMDIMPSGIGSSTLGGIMKVVTTGTSTGIAVGQSNTNRYTHIAANDIQVFNDDFFLSTRCAFPLSIGTCYTARLTFAATGIACFACRVCAPNINLSNGISINACSTVTVADWYNTNTDDGNGLYIKAGGVNSGKYIMALESAAGASRMIVLANGNIGIGTTSPGARLQVAGCVEANGSLYRAVFGTTVQDADMTGLTGGNASEVQIQASSISRGAYLTLGGGMNFGEAMGGIAFYNSNNVDGKRNRAFIVGGQEGATAGEQGSYLSFGTVANTVSVPSERIRINSTGFVGIGISTPAHLLDVRSANTSGATGATIRVGSQTHGGSDNEFANLEFYWGDPDSAEVKAKIYAKNVGNVGPGGGGAADLLFATTPAFGSSTERMRITSGGNVGIGTASPGFALDVHSGTAGSIINLNSTRLGGGGFAIANNSSARLYLGNANWLGISGESTSSTAIALASAENSAIIFATNAAASPAERMRITSGGNVGIGTASPANKLEVDGGSSAVALRVSTTNTGAGVASLILANSTKSAFNDGIVFSHGGGFTTVQGLSGTTNIMTYDVTNARVGIGTTSPGQRFSVVSADNTTSSIASFAAENLSQQTEIWYAGMRMGGTNTNVDLTLASKGTGIVAVTGIACFSSTVCAPCFATISDYRMKSNLQPIDGLSIIMNTKPYKFSYNYDCSTSFGMIAHELQDILPEAVFGHKDGEVMQGVDYMKLLPITIKAIQEQQCTINTLKTCLGII